MQRGGTSRAGQILSYRMLQMRPVQHQFSAGWFLRARGYLLLHQGDHSYRNSRSCISLVRLINLTYLSFSQDYRERWGTRCAGCGEYVEGDVVTAGEKYTFHPNCFHCQRCRQPLLGQGTKVSLVQGTCSNNELSNSHLKPSY